MTVISLQSRGRSRPLTSMRRAVIAQQILDDLPWWRLLVRRRARRVLADALRHCAL